MGYRARDSFIAYVGGTSRLFKKGDPIPDAIAAKVLALTYDDGVPAEPKPAKRTAKKSTASSD